MNAVIILAVISSMNSGLYGSSRVLYTQGEDGRVPAVFSKLSRRGVPAIAILACTAFLYIGVLISLIAGIRTFDYLMGSLGYTVLLIWLIIAIAHLKSRKRNINMQTYYVRGFPFTTWFSVAAIVLILAGVVITTSLLITAITLSIYFIICLTYVGRRKKQAARQAA